MRFPINLRTHRMIIHLQLTFAFQFTAAPLRPHVLTPTTLPDRLRRQFGTQWDCNCFHIHHHCDVASISISDQLLIRFGFVFAFAFKSLPVAPSICFCIFHSTSLAHSFRWRYDFDSETIPISCFPLTSISLPNSLWFQYRCLFCIHCSVRHRATTQINTKSDERIM